MKIQVAEYVNGPFAVVVTSPEATAQESFPLILAPKGGYLTKEAALGDIEAFNKASQESGGPELTFSVGPLWNPGTFGRWCGF